RDRLDDALVFLLGGRQRASHEHSLEAVEHSRPVYARGCRAPACHRRRTRSRTGFTPPATKALASARTAWDRRTQLHVVVIGCGRVGSELSGALELAGHTVAVGDKNGRAFRRLPPTFSGKTVVGFGFDRDHLAQAGISEAGAFASVTNGDNSNILCARIARE